ncbi:DNA recombination protein RmuC [Leeuwenhoekiella sp. LLG6367-2.1]|uniref:DNA recombination protein RmuC n=1 Tax=Leeuwenhoekiella sp. LLG6367-2.1 TaxID=3160833 RepID=UPI003869F342
MNESLLFLGIGLGCLLLGSVLGYFIARLKNKSETGMLTERLNLKSEQLSQSENKLKEQNLKNEHLQQKKEFLQNELTSTTVAYENLEQRIEEKTAELEQLQQKFTKDFEIVASKILDEKSSKFTLQNKENLDLILKPLHERINSFEKKVEDTNKESLGRHSELRQQIKGLADLNLQMSKDADNLTKALKGDSKIQGNWGELILTRVLEKSGLELGREYTIQDSHLTPEGKRLQTDVLIHLPDGKKMIIDSKVSLTAFERFVSEEDSTLKSSYLKQHIISIKKHIETLSRKNYYTLLEESPDTVFMFIPIEPAFAIASANEPQLYEDAFTKNVIIVTPSTLLAALKLVENLWQNDRQKRNAIEIATQAGKLYDAFTLLTDELIKIGNQLGTVSATYERTMTKLTGRGNLIIRVEKLRSLGAKATKQLDSNLVKRANDTLDYEKEI